MKHCHAQANQTTGRVLLVACVSALAGALTTSVLPPAHANPDLSPPLVPPNLEVPAQNKVFLVGHAAGTQQYICLFSGSSFDWTFFGPQATLFKNNKNQIITHFLSPNPFESGTARVTWQHSNDTSTVWAASIASSSASQFVAPGAIPWLLLQVVGDQPGPTGGERLTRTTFIQRLNTSGGVAPLSGCAALADIGKKALVPYTADYFFYESAESE
jgi:hypothetical protein